MLITCNICIDTNTITYCSNSTNYLLFTITIYPRDVFAMTIRSGGLQSSQKILYSQIYRFHFHPYPPISQKQFHGPATVELLVEVRNGSTCLYFTLHSLSYLSQPTWVITCGWVAHYHQPTNTKWPLISIIYQRDRSMTLNNVLMTNIECMCTK